MGFAAATKCEGDNILHLENQADFDQALIDMPVNGMMVKFYAPWCSHCKNMQDDWNCFAGEHCPVADFAVAEINCDDPENKRLVCKRPEINVTGYPTIMYFASPDALPEKYVKGRKLDSFHDFYDSKVNTEQPAN
jgi:thiol-disulfide isomerase/thioredoxin